jgi:hypothetical protein
MTNTLSSFNMRNVTNAYRIRFKGHLDSSWVEWFEGFTLTTQPDGTTILIGPVVDQPALFGLLTRINSLGLPILLVERLEKDINLD